MEVKRSHAVPDGNQTVLENTLIKATFLTDGFPQLAEFTNKATGRVFKFSEVQECLVQLASSEFRHDILWWRFCPGSGEAVPADQERGFLAGFHRSSFSEEKWISAMSINQWPIGLPGYSTVVYPGYGWYRTTFEIPETFQGKPIELGLGGCDHQDWLEYRVFLNGTLVGQANPEGFWHPVPKYTFQPTDTNYPAFKFGKENVLAVQTRGLDRRFPSMSVPDAERYGVGSLLFDQYVCVGSATREVKDFEQRSCRTFQDAVHASIEVVLVDKSETMEVKLTYRVNANESVFYKQVEVTNAGPSEQVLLELNLYKMTVDADLTIGGQGVPCFIGGELFGGVRHPAGIAKGHDRTLCLQSLPGRILKTGEKYVSKWALMGVGPAGRAGQSFTNYLERHGYRKRELVRMFHCYGIHDIAGIEEPTNLTEKMVLKSLDALSEYQKKGIHFDWYWIDAGWYNPKGDLKDFDPRFFPHGPGQVVRRVQELGMKLGLWTSPASGPLAFHPNPGNPRLTHPDDFCLADGKWGQMYQDALLYHVRENNVRGFKMDGYDIFCNRPGHRHLPGKYSVEPLADAMIDILENVRRVSPDIFYMFYWGIQSPWWLLHGDTIFERGIMMEGSTASDLPTRLLRQSVTISFDQASRHAWDRVPLAAGDSLGVWISKWRWANYMGAEGWQDAWVMDVARGSLLHQLWGDLEMFSAGDVTFLSRFSKIVRQYSRLLQSIPAIVGNPWTDRPYGYLYADSTETLLFLYNPQFLSDQIVIPQENNLKILLCPFEVKVIQVERASGHRKVVYPFSAIDRAGHKPADTWREETSKPVDWNNPSCKVILRKAVQGRAFYVESPKAYKSISFVSDERDRDILRRQWIGSVSLPSGVSEYQQLFVVVRLSRGGIYWHHHTLHDIILLTGHCGNKDIKFKSTPHRWHEEAGGWSWILFEALLPELHCGQAVSLHLETYLPRSVEMEMQPWLFREA